MANDFSEMHTATGIVEANDLPLSSPSSTTESQYFVSMSPKSRLQHTPSSNPRKTQARPTTCDAINETSSESSLSDPPSDIESPFPADDPLISTSLSRISIKTPQKTIKYTKSPYFPKKPSKPTSCLPFPSTSAETFGLMQEKLFHDPFRLIVATIFLNRTRGEQAMPVYYQLMERYPTIEALSTAQIQDVVAMIHKLGFQNQRARKCIELAKAWLDRPPVKGKRYRKMDYPKKGDGRDIGVDEVISDEDTRVGWEIGGLPGVGAYALDSWRIFCRDKLRELPKTSEGEENEEYEPEWTRVLPTDKELRAYLSWMWLKRGVKWNQESGAQTKADPKTIEKGMKGGIIREVGDNLVLESPIKNKTMPLLDVVEPAGAFLPSRKDKAGISQLEYT